MEEKGGDEGRMIVIRLIEAAVNSTCPEVDPRLLKAIKSTVRESDSELRLAARTLMILMKRDHSQVRYLALLIIDELFTRSKLFRTLLVEELDQLLTLSIGFRKNLPLPPPSAVATILRSKAIELLEKWNSAFGIHYRQLRLGYDYLKNTLRYQFPNLQENAARIQRERRERELRTKEILLNKFEMLKENLPSIKAEMSSTVDEINECLDIISNKDEDFPLHPLDDEDLVEFRSSELLKIRLDSLKEGEKAQENSDNEVVFDTLRELYKVLVTKHLASLQEWISVLIRVEMVDYRFRDSTLKDFIDIRNSLQEIKKKCEESGCSISKTINYEEELIWEEGSTASIEKFALESSTEPNEGLATTSTPSLERREVPECRNKQSNNKHKPHGEVGKTRSDPTREKLLAEAPILNWSSCLDQWGSNRDVLANQRGLELEGHWGRVDYDAVIPSDKIAELNVHTSLYKEEHVDIQPCHAPLRKGGLCQRRDIRICPFHGPIIPRDDGGKPIDKLPPPSAAEIIPNPRSDLLQKLANQVVKNVRERDKEEEERRKLDKQALKRAKLAKVREHNTSVLRDAAMASTSTSFSIVEDVETSNGSKSSSRNRDTLASMLKKKENAKDRLARRLLSSRRGARVRACPYQ